MQDKKRKYAEKKIAKLMEQSTIMREAIDKYGFGGADIYFSLRLIDESEKLSTLTKWLIGLTAILGILTLATLVMMLGEHFHWFGL